MKLMFKYLKFCTCNSNLKTGFEEVKPTEAWYTQKDKMYCSVFEGVLGLSKLGEKNQDVPDKLLN